MSCTECTGVLLQHITLYRQLVQFEFWVFFFFCVFKLCLKKGD